MAFHETDAYQNTDNGGACYFCQSDQRTLYPGGRSERLWRSDASPEWEGDLVICETCLSELAGNLGWVTPAKGIEARDEIRRLKKLLKETERERDLAVSVIDSLHEYQEAASGA